MDIAEIQATKDFSETELLFLMNRGLRESQERLEPSTLRVPEDYPTIQQAVRESIEHNTISVRPGVYNEHISIENKTLTLHNRDPSQETVLKTVEHIEHSLSSSANSDNHPSVVIHIKNSRVKFSYLQFSSRQFAETAVIENSEVDFLHCMLQGTPSIPSFNFVRKKSQPALLIKNNTNQTIRLIDSELKGGAKSEKESIEGATIRMDSCSDTVLQLSNTTVYGGSGTSNGQSGSTLTNPGGPAIYITNSNRIQIQAMNSSFVGGKGGDSAVLSGRGSSGLGFTTSGREGGVGCLIDGSSVEITHGTIQGGNGGDGFEFFSDFINDMVIGVPGLGGCGIQLIHHSKGVLNNGTVIGGQAGFTDKTVADAVCIDETSTFQRINSSTVTDWQIY